MPQATTDRSRQSIADVQDASHYPPELLQLLQNAVPLLCASKRDTILFFQALGVPESWLVDMLRQVETCRVCITKSSIAHDVLEKLNLKKENHLRELHEVVRQVAGFDDFSTCSPTDRTKAMGLVAAVRRVVDVKDSFRQDVQQHLNMDCPVMDGASG